MLIISSSLNVGFFLISPIFYFFLLGTAFVYLQAVLNKTTGAVAVSATYSPVNMNLIFSLSLPMFSLSFVFYGYESVLWFGHFFFSLFSWKVFFLIFFVFNILSLGVVGQFKVLSREFSDFVLVLLNLFLWIFGLFVSNTFIAIFFVIEILSTLLMLMLITGGDVFFRKNLKLPGSRQNQSITTPPFSAVFIFFWTSLLMSFFLFLTLLNCWKTLHSVDLFFLEFLFALASPSFTHLLPLVFFLFFSFFMKCGVVPFFFWKPLFFRNLPLLCLYIYVVFFFFFLLLFFFHLFVNFFLVFLQPFSFFFSFILVGGFFFLIFSLCESFYIKTFIALSSILNTFLLFFPLITNIIFFFF